MYLYMYVLYGLTLKQIRIFGNFCLIFSVATLHPTVVGISLATGFIFTLQADQEI